MLTKSNSVVAFIDILGFKEIVRSNEKSSDNKIICELNNAFEQAYKKSISLTQGWLNGMIESNESIVGTQIKHRQFSDNIYFSYEFKEDNSDFELAFYLITMMAAYYQRIMLEKGFYVRGGISAGTVYFDEHMIFSNALLKAYDIESKIAKYPRIAIDNNILKLLSRTAKRNIIKTWFPKLIVRDWTGIAFLNPFKIMELVQSMVSEVPEVLEELNKIALSSPQIIEIYGILEPDIPDQALTELVWDRIKLRLKKHKSDKDIYEKFLWLREFVNWQDDYKSSLDFKYYK